MHRALELEDILSRIAISLAYDAMGYSDFANALSYLAVLARVSQAFSKVALRELWGTHSSLKGLLKCFPEEVWEERNKRLYFRRPPLSEEWARFEYYSALITDLVFEPHNVDISVVFTHISLFRPTGGGLLRNLRCLHIPEAKALYFARLLLSSGLRRLSLCLTTPMTCDEYAVLESLPKLCPELEILKMSKFILSAESYNDVVCSIVPRFKNMRELDCCVPLTDVVLRNIAGLPHLLNARFIVSRNLNSWDAGTGRAIFPSLEKLDIRSSPRISISLLQSLSSTRLRELRLSFDGDITPNLLRQNFQVSCQAGLNTLTGLCICFRSSRPTGTLYDIVTLDPLRSLSNINSLAMSVPNFTVDNTALLTISAWWPAMRDLDIMTMEPPADTPLPTLEGLAQMLTRCRQLRSLSLGGIDARKIPPPAITAPDANANLLELNFYWSSPIHDGCRVAAFLSSIAPSLDDVFCHGINAEWKTVRQALEMLSLVRAQERRWHAAHACECPLVADGRLI